MDNLVMNNEGANLQDSFEIRVYRRRWLILLLFSGCNFFNSFHWIEYSIIANVISYYYSSSPWVIDWLSLIYMVAYVVCIFPATYLLDKKGLRTTVLLGIFGTAVGAWIKVLSVSPERLYITFLGQAIEAISCTFLFGVPPKLAAVWFGPDQVSTASGIGVMSAELGIAVGFLIPPLMVVDNEDLDSIGKHLRMLHLLGSIPPTVLLLLVAIFFQNEPRRPPSRARAMVMSQKMAYRKSLKNIICNRSFICLLLAYSLCHALLTAISTLLNQIVLAGFPHSETDSGVLGNANMCVSIVGGFLSGIWLDKTHRFRQSNLVIYAISLAGMLGFTLSVFYSSLPWTYVFFVGSGFFFGAYTTLGYEHAVELTYPEPEGTTSGIINMTYFVASIFMTLIAGWLLRTFGNLAADLFFCGVMAVGLFFSLFIGKECRRLEAQTLSPALKDSV